MTTGEIKYFVYDYKEFIAVTENEYAKWLEEKWQKLEPHFFSRFIGEILYTVQTFYDGILNKGDRLKPFSIFYMEGAKHKVRHFKEWLTFQMEYEKLIALLIKKEEQHLRHKTGKPAS